MNGEALIYRPNTAAPERQTFTEQPDLKFWQQTIGGYIESVPGFATIEIDGVVRPCVVFCNENGKLNQLPHNHSANLLWDRALRRLFDDTGKRLYPNGLFTPDGRLADWLCGPIVVITGDAEFMAGL